MLPLQFFGQNVHFAISLFAALVFFAVFWLYFDAYSTTKNKKEIWKWAGFLLVSLSFTVHATVIEQSVLGRSIFGDSSATIAGILQALGFIGIIIGQLVDPLQDEPEVAGLETELTANSSVSAPPSAAADMPPPTKSQPSSSVPTIAEEKPPQAPLPAIVTAKSAYGLVLALPAGALIIALLYLRRATKGLEHHLMPVAVAFFVLFGFELLSLADLASDSTNPTIENLVRPFGWLWMLSHALLFLAALLLGRWVWKYLIKRFQSQLFMLFTTMTLAVFLVTTVSFTFLLMRNIQKSALDNLETAASVLNYALDSKKAETRANAQVVAQNPEVAAAIAAKDHKSLVGLTDTFLETKKQSSLVITNQSGQVLLRAEDPDRWGDSLSSDTLIRRALVGTEGSTIDAKEGVLAPVMLIKTAVPVRDSAGNIAGAAVTGLAIDNTFVDGIKNSTGLDSAIYADNVRAATTFLAPDGKSRWVGTKEEAGAVKNTVLTGGKVYKGSLSVLNRQFLAVYMPLRDGDNAIVGMLFIGQPQSVVLQNAGRSIELTFVVAAILLLLAIIPAYFFSRQLSSQLE